MADRLEHINTVYGYKYFGDYELSPEQLDVVGEAVMFANRVPNLLAAAKAVLNEFGHREGEDDALMDPQPQQLMDALQRAIAKAEG
jgi:hypothetical protein